MFASLYGFSNYWYISKFYTQYKIKLNSNNKTFNAEYNPSNIKIPNKDDCIITLWHIHRDSYEEYFGEKVIYRAF